VQPLHLGQRMDIFSPSLNSSIALLFQEMKAAEDADKVQQALKLTVMSLQQLNPMYAETTSHGDHSHPQQQDASEAWTTLFSTMQHNLPAIGGTEPAGPGKSAIDQLFGMATKSTFTCTEDESDKTQTEESSLIFSCPIEKETSFVLRGLEQAFQGTVEKESASLGRTALYSKTTEFERLPGYLCVNLVRFFFKKKEQVICKKMRDVKFSQTLDVIKLCSPELTAKLAPQREAFEAHRNFEAEKQVDASGGGVQAGGLVDGKRVLAAEEEAKEYESYSFDSDPGSNASGYYELQAVLTHKGRDSASGHYIGWCLLPDGRWVKFDDDKVSVVDEKTVMALSGGGDNDTAYILVYGAKKVPKGFSTASLAAAKSAAAGGAAMESAPDGAGAADAGKMDVAE